MAQIKLTWTERKTRSKRVEIPFIDDLKEYFGSDVACEEEYILECLIEDYYCYNNDPNFLYQHLSEEEQEYYYDDLEAKILYMDEIIKENLHFIEAPKPVVCCANQTTNYCPHCGKKLKQ
jgi:hypothetical protein